METFAEVRMSAQYDESHRRQRRADRIEERLFRRYAEAQFVVVVEVREVDWAHDVLRQADPARSKS